MRDEMISPEVEEALKELGCTTIHNKTSVGGGCISQAFTYNTDNGKYFVKVCFLYLGPLVLLFFFVCLSSLVT